MGRSFPLVKSGNKKTLFHEEVKVPFGQMGKSLAQQDESDQRA